MVHSVYFDPAVGGDGTTVTDDTDATTGLDDYGYVQRFVPALSQILAVALFILTKANEAAASAASALGAPGTNANSTTSLTIGTGSKTFTIETGKQFNIGQVVVAASKANPANSMTGTITAVDNTTGSLTISVAAGGTSGSGTLADWTISLSAVVSNILPSQTGNSGKYLTTDGTNASWVAVLPTQTSNSGKFLTTNGTSASWATVLPSQSSNGGKFLTTDGTSASWASVLVPSSNLSDLSNAVTARANLGLGALAVKSTVDNGNWDGGGTPLSVSNGGTGAATAAAARAALGIGTAGQANTGTGSSDVPLISQADARYMKQGKFTIPIQAGAMTPRITNGAALGITESTTNKVMSRTLDFDQSTAEYAQIAISMPKDWDAGTITAQFGWLATATGNVVWGAQGLARSDDDAVDTAFGTAVTVTDSVTAVGDLMVTAETGAITLSGTPAQSDTLILQVYRDAANAADTLAADAKLLWVKIFYTVNAANDA